MTDTELKSFINIIFFLIAILIIHMSAGTKATYIFLLLVLAGVIVTHINQIKSLAQ